ncbi:hypothetical protein FRC03_012884 [Tulasnella sp. 419]|nr:hypothetical protein FRC03_012884 [Tulasnella sp. 419]
MSFKATVKSCSSGDTIILRGAPGPQGQPPKERTVHLADISAPRLGTSQREDELWAYESREFLRALVVNKQVTVTSTHSLPPSDGSIRDIGTVQVNGVDLITEVIRNGWAKLKEIKREPTEEDLQRRALETEAKNGGKGIWNPEGPPNRTVYHTMPNDSQSFITEWKGKPIPAVVEQVRDGSTLRVRLLLSDELHQYITLAMAGIRSPKAAGREGEAAEPFGEEAKFFVESRLLQRHVTVTLLSLPAPSAAPFSASGTSTPQAASVIIGTVMHPAGNIAEHLVAGGYARVIDWHAGMLSASGGMERLRAAERAAKEKKLNLYASFSTPSNTASGSKAPSGSRAQFEAQVVRVWSGDQISVFEKETGQERRIQLSSVRGPKASDPKQTYWANEAREFLRKKLIGKTVKVHIDFIRPKEGEFEERECATVRFGGSQANVAEQLIEKGLATAVRHKRDDENRSPDYDKLMAAEQSAAAEGRGMHSGKEQSVPRVGNASESHTKASQFLSSFKRAGRVPAVVDFVAAGSRYKLLLPKENQTLTFVLSGIRAPRAARNPGEKSEPYGNESLDFASRRYMQRDVEVEFEAVDKSGGFIGALYLNKTENAAVALVQEGLGTVHDYSAEGLSWAKQLYDAEAEAKKARKNLWKDYDEEAEAAAEITTTETEVAAKPNYQDVIISDVRTSPVFGFSVQFLNNDGIKSLEKLMHDFTLHYRGSTSPPDFVPKAGQLVSARFSGDNGWYRAKVRRASPAKKEAELTFIDYGNQETVAFAHIRPLDSKFQSLPAQAQDARLSFVKLVDPSSEYHEDSAGRFRELVEGKNMIANIDSKEGNLLHLRLIDPADPTVKDDPLACINTQLVGEGLAVVDRKGCKYISVYPAIAKRLSEEFEKAKSDRAGIYEFGDVSPDDV